MKQYSAPFQEIVPDLEKLTPLGDYEGKLWGIDAPVNSDPLTAALQRLPRRRVFWLFVIAVLLVMGVFLFRLLQLQVVQGATLRVAAEENRIRLQTTSASRGMIYDRFGKPLVQNVADLTIEVIPGDLPKQQALHDEAASLATLLGEATGVVEHDLIVIKQKYKENPYQPQAFRLHVPYATVLRIQLAERTLQGVSIAQTASRSYTAGNAFSHLLGYTGKFINDEWKTKYKSQGYQYSDVIGKQGLEKVYENTLRGQDGQTQEEVNSSGREQRIVAAQEPVAGKNIFLSIDAGLQQKAFDTLSAMVTNTKAPGGALVAVDPRNGHILAMVSVPSYDNNVFVNGIDAAAYSQLLNDPHQPLFDRATSGQYPPGSTIKPFMASAALQEHVIAENTTVLSTGGISIGPWFFPDWKPGGHGVTDVKKAIAESVNSFFYTIGGGTPTFQGLGVDRIAQYLHRFGFGTATRIDIPGEKAGLVPSPDWKQTVKKERWFIGDTYHLAIGQGDLLVTPLQMAIATATVANGGTLYRPTVVNEITDSATPSTGTPAGIVNAAHFIDANNLQIVRAGMRQTVLAGSARSAQSLPVAVAGKTGTAQFGVNKQTNAWFTAFAPYDNPEIALAVVIEAGGEGHEAALPVAEDVLRWYFTPH